MTALGSYYEKILSTIISSNLSRLMSFAGITFKIDRPQADQLYDEAYGSLAREYDYQRITPDGKGIMNVSEFEFIPFSPEEMGRFDIGYLYTFDDVRVSDKIIVIRGDSLAEEFRVMDKEQYGILNQVVNRLLVKPF